MPDRLLSDVRLLPDQALSFSDYSQTTSIPRLLPDYSHLKTNPRHFPYYFYSHITMRLLLFPDYCQTDYFQITPRPSPFYSLTTLRLLPFSKYSKTHPIIRSLYDIQFSDYFILQFSEILSDYCQNNK